MKTAETSKKASFYSKKKFPKQIYKSLQLIWNLTQIYDKKYIKTNKIIVQKFIAWFFSDKLLTLLIKSMILSEFHQLEFVFLNENN